MNRQMLLNRVAIVTGGARGIGKEICKTLLDNGASVVCADNGVNIDGTAEDPSITATFCKDYPDKALAFTDDISSSTASKKLVNLAQENFGGIDIVVNCAAILRDGLVFKGSPENWDVVLKNNLSATFYLINAATQIMREQFKNGRGPAETYSWGRIVNIGSTAGLYGNFGQANYGSAKAGLFGLTRITAMEMVRSNVTCNYLAPFAHSRVTDMIEPANEEQAEYKNRALKVKPHHVARFVSYLCSDYAKDITGQVFGVRGREIFLFSQPRPISTIISDENWDDRELGENILREFDEYFSDLKTDLEAFNSDPII